MAGPMLAAPHLFQHHHHLSLAANSQASPADSQKSEGKSIPTDSTSDVSDPSPTGQSWLSDTEAKDNFYQQFATRHPYQLQVGGAKTAVHSAESDPTDEVVTCPDCGQLLLNHQYFQRHLEECHNVQERSDSAVETPVDRGDPQQLQSEGNKSRPSTLTSVNSGGGLLQLQSALDPSSTGVTFSQSSPTGITPEMSVMTSASITAPTKIFNPEAYCELCNKEFCNKYFLKTHKANKHGIYNDEMGNFSTSSNRSPPTMVPSTQHNAYAGLIKSHFAASLMSEDCHTAETFQSDTDATMTALRQLTGAPLQRTTSTGEFTKRQDTAESSVEQPENLSLRTAQNKSIANGYATKKSQFGAVDNQILADSLGLPTSQKFPLMGGGPATPKATFPDLYCPICQQTFANPYVLQSHMLAMHSGNFNPTAAMNLQAFYASMMGVGPSPFGHSSGHSAMIQAGMLAERMKLMAAASNSQTAAMMGLMPPLQIPESFHRSMMQPVGIATSTSTSPPVFKGLVTINNGNGHNSLPGSAVKSELPPMINNKEAFCEICRKEFCNKYFLRTHKQNKHGIFDESMSYRMFANRPNGSDERDMTGICDISPPGASGTDRPINADGSYVDTCGDSNDDSMVCVDDMTENRPSVITTGPAPSMELSGSPIKQDLKRSYSDTDAMERTPPMKLPKREVKTPPLTPIAEQSENSLISLQLNTFPSRSNSISEMDRSRMSCHKCPKSFTSVFAMVTHSIQEHGEPMDPTGLFARASMGLLPAQSDQFQADSVKQEILENQTAEGLVGTSPDAYCEICKKEFCSKYFLRTHKLNIHGINSDASPNSMCPSTGQSLNSFAPATSTSDMVTSQSAMPLAVSNSPTTTTAVMNVTPSSRPFATGKNFCDVCNKELCNKYFLRTHMLKMHGVVVDENKMIIGSVGTTERGTLPGTGYPCDICHKELSSRHFLRIHRQNAHGVRDETPAKSAGRTGLSPVVTAKIDEKVDSSLKPSDFSDQRDNRYFSHYTEVCPLCDRRFKSSKWLRTHMWTEHKAIPEMFPGSTLKLKSTGPAKPEAPLSNVQALLESVLNVEFPHVLNNNNATVRTPVEDIAKSNIADKPHSESDSLTPPDASCDFCGEAFKNFADLQTHTAQQHSNREALEQSDQFAPQPLNSPNFAALPTKPFVMQPFYVQEENPKGVIVPSMIYLPVGEDIREPMNICIHISPVKFNRNGRCSSPSLASRANN